MSAGPRAERGLLRRAARRIVSAAERVHLSYVIVAAAFAASRIAYRTILDLELDATPFGYFLQYAPRWFFEHDFWRTIFHLHHQAPLQNLLVGGCYRLFGDPACFVVLDAVYLSLGFTFAMTLLGTMRRLGVSTALATVGTCVYVISPVVVGYELWLFYHTPVITFLMLGAWGLLRFYEVGTTRAGVFAFSMLAIAALFRNLYGPAWLAVTAGLLLLRPPPRRAPRGSPRRMVLLAAAIPLAIVTANDVKNRVILGRSPSASLVVGNLVAKIWPHVPALERERLEREHLVSRAVRFEPFTSVEELGDMRSPHPPTGVPLLDMPFSPDGQRNHHTLEIVLIGERFYAKDAAFLLRNHPSAYLESVEAALSSWYLSSPTRDIIFSQTPNYKRLRPLERRLAKAVGVDASGRLKILAVGLPFAFLYGIHRALRPRSLLESERSKTAALLFMTMTIAYVTAATTLISFGDFSRYRFDIDPLSFVIIVMFLQHAANSALALGRAGLARLLAARSSAAPQHGWR